MKVMNPFSRRAGLMVSVVGLVVGMIVFFHSNSLVIYFVGIIGSVSLHLFIWKFAYFVQERNRLGLALCLCLLILLSASFVVLLEDRRNSFDCFSSGHEVYENRFTGEKRGFMVECNGRGKAWYWKKVSITSEECYKLDSCEVSTKFREYYESKNQNS